jgi:hypothetical protein
MQPANPLPLGAEQDIPMMAIPTKVYEASETLYNFFTQQGITCWQFGYVADRRLVARLESENERLRDALAFIRENGGQSMETECGSMRCNGAWCAEQASSAIYATKSLEN